MAQSGAIKIKQEVTVVGWPSVDWAPKASVSIYIPGESIDLPLKKAKKLAKVLAEAIEEAEGGK